MIVILTQCFPPDAGGIEGLMGGLADALAAAGEPVTVLADRIRGAGAERTTPYPVRRFGGPRPWRRFRKMRALRQLSPSAVIADSYKSVQTLPALAAPVLVLAHGTEFPLTTKASKAARMRRALAKARWVIANSQYTAAQVTPYLEDARRVCVIHPPIAAQPEPDATSLAEMDEIIAGRSPVLASLSRLEPRKGVDQVLRAMPAVLRAHPNAVYIVAGGGEDRARLEALAHETGVAHAVYFLGRVDDAQKAALLSRADIFVMPVRREDNSVEGFGIAYVEAAWYGVPAIAGREGGAVDAVIDGQTGLICDGAEVSDVTRAILQLLSDDALRARLGAAAKTRARTELQWGATVARYLELCHPERSEGSGESSDTRPDPSLRSG